MKRPAQNYLLDWLAFTLLAGLAATGMVLHFALPPGSRDATVFELTRHEWGEIHFWIALGFLGLIGLHLVLHGAWIKALTLGRSTGGTRRWRALLAIGGGVVAIAVAVLGILAPTQVGEGLPRHSDSQVERVERGDLNSAGGTAAAGLPRRQGRGRAR